MANVYANSVLDHISTLIDEVGAHAKQASVKKADVDGSGDGGYKTDPGHIGGASSHPTAKADGGNHSAKYGARGQENCEDVKKDVANSTDEVSTSVNKDDSDHDQYNIGIRQSATGEDPSVENSYKGHKDDPGTTSPAKVEGGEKYSSVAFPQLCHDAFAGMEDLLARLGADEKFGKTAATNEIADAAAAGYALADLAAARPDDARLVKLAAASEIVAGIIREAYEDADLAGEFLYKMAANEEEAMLAAQGAQPDAGGAPAGGDPAAAMGGMGAPPGAEGAPGGLPEEMGGGEVPPPDAGAAGAEGAPDAGGGGEDVVNEMANAIVDAGIPVEPLIAALQAHLGAAGGEGGGAEGGPPMDAGAKSASAKLPKDETSMLLKIAYDIKNLEDSGKFRRVTMSKLTSKQAKDDRAGAVDYFNYVREVLSR